MRPRERSWRIASRASLCFSALGENSGSWVKSSASRPTSRGVSEAPPSRKWSAASDVEAEADDVAVAHSVVLAFQAQLARLLRALLATARDEVIVGGDLGADEATSEVGVDHRRRLRRGGSRRNGPGAHLLRTGGEVGVQPEQPVRGADHAVEPRLVHPHVLEKQLLVLVGHVGDLRLDGSADRDHRRALLGRVRDRKSTRLNSSHSQISYAVFCLKKKNR